MGLAMLIWRISCRISRSSFAGQSGAILIATANGAKTLALPLDNRCWLHQHHRVQALGQIDIATPTGSGLRRRAAADPSVAAAGRPLDAEARQAQVPGKRGYEVE